MIRWKNFRVFRKLFPLHIPQYLFIKNISKVNDTDLTSRNMSGTFMYYAYGSNMLQKRIHINNPTAIQRNIGKLKGHRLDFIRYSPRWHGCASTIVPDEKAELWGVIWEIDMINLPDLDHQEGVEDNIYFAKNIIVHTPDGKEIECRVYQQCILPDTYIKPSDLPSDRQPSLVYLNTMLKGAREFNIPEYYIKFLESFRNNGYAGETELPGITAEG